MLNVIQSSHIAPSSSALENLDFYNSPKSSPYVNIPPSTYNYTLR